MGCFVGFSHQARPFLVFSMLMELRGGSEGLPEGDSSLLPVHPMVVAYIPGSREKLACSSLTRAPRDHDCTCRGDRGSVPVCAVRHSLKGKHGQMPLGVL